MSYEKLGFVSGQKLKAEHLNHMEDGIANISWNDLADKPFGEETTTVSGDTLTWDGNTEGLVNTNNAELPMYKVSDVIITKSDLTNGISFVVNGEEESIDWETFQSAVNDDDFGLLEAVAIVPYDNYNFDNGIVFPEAGVYFINIPNVACCSSFTIHGYTGFVTTGTVVKPLDEKYLPDSVKGGGDIVIVSVSFETLMLSHTPDEIDAMQKEGKMVLLSLTGTTLKVRRKNGVAYATSCVVVSDDNRIRLQKLSFDTNGLFISEDNYVLTATEE